MCFELIKKILSGQTDTCQPELVACKDSLGKAQSSVDSLTRQLQDMGSALSACNTNLASCNDAQAALQKKYDALATTYDLLKNGPPAPTKADLRVLTAANCQQLLIDRLGQPFLDCLARNQVHFAWPPWLIAKQDQVERYISFYNANILPLMKDYVVLDWTDQHGNKLQISGRTCSDFSALFWGLPTMHLGWTPMCWGVFWAYVESLFLTGGHAFNWVVVWKEDYDDDSTSPAGSAAGLELLEIEPQTSGHWTAGGVALDSTAKVESLLLKPITPDRFTPTGLGGYKLDQIWNVEA